MKYIFTFLAIAAFSTACHAQDTDYLAQAINNSHPNSYVLIDSLDGTKYLLDSTRIFITAIDTNGKVKWKTDAWKDNKIEVYRIHRPIIVFFDFVPCPMDEGIFKQGQQVIGISYNNSQFGNIDKRTGRFLFLGQD